MFGYDQLRLLTRPDGAGLQFRCELPVSAPAENKALLRELRQLFAFTGTFRQLQKYFENTDTDFQRVSQRIEGQKHKTSVKDSCADTNQLQRKSLCAANSPCCQLSRINT